VATTWTSALSTATPPAAGHQGGIAHHTTGEVSSKNLLDISAHVGNDLGSGHRKPLIKRSGNRTAYQHLHAESSNVGRPVKDVCLVQ